MCHGIHHPISAACLAVRAFFFWLGTGGEVQCKPTSPGPGRPFVSRTPTKLPKKKKKEQV
uniref:Secreted protein n=1 Tax=Zea mays TaxID=4577 RepID=C0PCH6_MAIZE|nr:unknown [Zea mays]